MSNAHSNFINKVTASHPNCSVKLSFHELRFTLQLGCEAVCQKGKGKCVRVKETKEEWKCVKKEKGSV